MQRLEAVEDLKHVYKVLRPSEHSSGIYEGSPLDRRDGFVHLSPLPALARTMELHFANETELLIIGFTLTELGPALKWDKSRDDLLFPHLYAPLDLERAIVRRNVVRTADGKWQSVADLAA